MIILSCVYFCIALRGAAALRARTGRRERDASANTLPVEENNNCDFDFDFAKYRALLARGAEVEVRTSDGKEMPLLSWGHFAISLTIFSIFVKLGQTQ